MIIIRIIRRLKSSFLLWYSMLDSFVYDFRSFYRISNVTRQRKTKDQCIGSIIGSYHIIEKGLAMPHRRLGFGIPALRALINECKEFLSHFGSDNSQFVHAVQVIFEYEKLHEDNGYSLPIDLKREIEQLHASLPLLAPSCQVSLSRDEFFNDVNASFDAFSNSRHSTRHFNGAADKETIIQAISLAQNAPSSCNKQPTRVHLVTNNNLVNEILQKQGGNRGFGQDIKSIIVLTTNISCYSQVGERRSGFVDLGIYSMNLLYALHFYKIGAIPLIWLSSKKRDKWLNDILEISANNEIPVLIVGVGKVSDYPSLVNSPRKKLNEVLTIHE